jgi:uncharacterized protein (UPF0332 family)
LINDAGNKIDVAKHKLERALDDLESARLLLQSGKYKAANNRAYYSCFHAIDAVLALEPIAFKKHKDTLAYFNKNYIHTGIFSKEIGRKISKLEVIRHKSDYDDFYIASQEEAEEQILTAETAINLVSEYLENNN